MLEETLGGIERCIFVDRSIGHSLRLYDGGSDAGCGDRENHHCYHEFDKSDSGFSCFKLLGQLGHNFLESEVGNAFGLCVGSYRFSTLELN